MSADFLIFNRALKKHQRERAVKTLPNSDFLYHEAAARLADRLDAINREFPLTLDLGTRGGLLTPMLKEHPSVKTIFGSDLAKAWATDFVCDEEFLPLKVSSLNLITSLLNLHWVNDLPGALIQIRQALAPDGLFLGSMFGGMTLHELRQAQVQAEMELYGGISPRISPFTDVREMAGLLQRAGFALPVADTETVTVFYQDAYTLMRDLKAMGENNALLKRPNNFMSKRAFSLIAKKYQELFGSVEGIPATFEIITMTGWNEPKTSGGRTP
jgi:SAM-dependent methyltransferase